MKRKHAHYFRNVAHLSELDVYRVLDLFGVTDQALGHAIKKLLAPGGRGAGKDFRRDVQEAIDTLTRRLEMLDEDAAADAVVIPPPPEYEPASVAFGAKAGVVNWIAWHGGECPVAENTEVAFILRSGLRSEKNAGSLLWGHEYGQLDIIAYRVVTN